MKKLFSLTVVLLLAMSILTVPSMAAGENDEGAFGYLSYVWQKRIMLQGMLPNGLRLIIWKNMVFWNPSTGEVRERR